MEGGGAPGSRAEIPHSHEPIESCSVSDIYPAGHGQPHTRADGDPTREAVTHEELKKKPTLG